MDHISTNSNNKGNDTDIQHEKNKARVSFQTIATYVGPMIMGVGGEYLISRPYLNRKILEP